jgi:hypothetical protein
MLLGDQVAKDWWAFHRIFGIGNTKSCALLLISAAKPQDRVAAGGKTSIFRSRGTTRGAGQGQGPIFHAEDTLFASAEDGVAAHGA